ncbi:MAG: fatty acid hydroxylase [Acidobacteria bacterium]|nr:MAG: fatty acid hydroxylase [Acidobacteriota bacterium]
MSELPGWLTPAALLATLVLMTALEEVRPLRRRVEAAGRHLARNVAMGTISLAVLTLVQTPFLLPLTEWAQRKQVGLLNLVALPAWAELALGVLFLDYTLWHWHRINHLWPFLWRFHAVHHVDLDLDASTALRFHFGELALSAGYRLVQVVVLGPSPLALGSWQLLLFVSILFHHSNLRLPLGLERALVRVVVTPRMHGIHHSLYLDETNANWSSLLSVWDYVHRTAVLGIPQDEVVIGVPTCREPRKVTLGRILVRPFESHPEDHGPPGRVERPHAPAAVRGLAP